MSLAKNGPHMTDQVMAKDAKKAKVSKRLQKQGEVVIANFNFFFFFFFFLGEL